VTTIIEEMKFHGLAVYNPGLLSRAELISQFVARRSLLERLLADLARPGFNQHQLIVGHRGMGKTMLLRRLSYAVDDDPTLSGAWMPLAFPEEQYNVSRLSDFYVNCIDALGDALEQTGKRSEATLLDMSVESLPADEDQRAHAALDLLLGAADRFGRRLLLLVDNVDLVLDRLSEQQWCIRELLSHEERLLLIGATPVAIGATYTYEEAFYDFFQVHELSGLTHEETREVLRHLAIETGRSQVIDLLDSDPARVQTLHTLTGGNPRTIVLLFEVLARGTDGDVRSDLERLLDQCTPLYKARFESFPQQAQQVIHALAIHWHPISSVELATVLRLEVNVVSAQLNRLTQQAVVEKVPYEPQSKTGFQIAERFFNIWYLMRASRRVRRRLTWLVEFLRCFHGTERLVDQAHLQLRVDGGNSSDMRLRHAELCLALAEGIGENPSLSAALQSRAIESILHDSALRSQIEGLLDLDGADASLRPAVNRHTWAADLEAILREIPLPPGFDREGLLDLIGGSTMGQSDKLAHAHRLAVMDEASVAKFCEVIREQAITLRKAFGKNLAAKLQTALRRGYVDTITDIDGLQTASLVLGAPEIEAVMYRDNEPPAGRYEELALQTGDAYCWERYARHLADQDLWELAEPAYRKALEVDPDFVRPSLEYVGLLCATGRSSDGERMLVSVMEQLSDQKGAWVLLGRIRCVRLHWPEAEDAFRRALALDDADSINWSRLSATLEMQARWSEALEAWERAVAFDPSQKNWARRLGAALQGRVEHAELARLAKAAVAAFPESPTMLGVAAVLLQFTSLAEAIDFAQRACDLDSTTSWHHLNLAVLLVFNSEWDRALQHVRRLFATLHDLERDQSVAELRIVLEVLAANGLAAECVQLIDEAGVADELRPFREALDIYASGNMKKLKRLAPEVRTPTKAILESWAINKEQPKKQLSVGKRRQGRGIRK
jgi:tetratricopeptide (TPR) repeat protein